MKNYQYKKEKRKEKINKKNIYLLFSFFFFINITSYTFNFFFNKIRIPENHSLLFNTYYKELLNQYLPTKADILFYQMIEETQYIECYESIFNNLFIVSPQTENLDKYNILEMLSKKVPLFINAKCCEEGLNINGKKYLIEFFEILQKIDKNKKNLFITNRIKELNKAKFKNDYDSDNLFIYTKSTIPIAIATTYPWFYKNNEILIEVIDNQLGLIEIAGANFEGRNSPDFINFNEANDTDSLKLETHINNTIDAAIYAALQLTINNNKTICHINYPLIGLGAFSTHYEYSCYNKKREIKDLYLFYLKALYKALNKYSKNKNDIKIEFDIFNFIEKDFDIFYEINKQKIENVKIEYKYSEEKANLFKKSCHGNLFNNDGMLNLEYLKNRQIVVIMASDVHAFIGNGGSIDASLEQYWYNFFNNDIFYVPRAYLNMLWPYLLMKKFEDKCILYELNNENQNFKNNVSKYTFEDQITKTTVILFILLACMTISFILFSVYTKNKFLNIITKFY
jgi:hypothetical protein